MSTKTPLHWGPFHALQTVKSWDGRQHKCSGTKEDQTEITYYLGAGDGLTFDGWVLELGDPDTERFQAATVRWCPFCGLLLPQRATVTHKEPIGFVLTNGDTVRLEQPFILRQMFAARTVKTVNLMADKPGREYGPLLNLSKNSPMLFARPLMFEPGTELKLTIEGSGLVCLSGDLVKKGKKSETRKPTT